MSAKAASDWMCPKCGKRIDRDPVPLQPLPGIKRRCAVCIFKRTAQRYLKNANKWKVFSDMWVMQQGRCAYTDDDLELGLTATIDHVHPRFLGGINDPSNLLWVHTEINKLKGSMTLNDFLEICRKVAHGPQNYARSASGE